ncbi:MAG TPA: zf-TFIIB domain-containing protein [Kofleriaceae bacterium]|nr:zf-TFIIB domain-containing protein [Kofleriaceae bacterium]
MILACPTCDSRYDVTGYPPGQQFRCRCGTVTTLQATSSQAGLLSCPHCGAAVAESERRCAHCSADLLVKACPRCLQRAFAGDKHCPSCGAELGVAADGATLPDQPCPRCETTLRARLVGEIVIDECGTCQGLFLDHVAIRRVIEDRRQARADALLGALPHAEVHAMVRPGERMYLKCPVCHVVMNRKLFAAGTGVIVDVCRTHGTFFDAGELPAVIEFVMKGGLEAAQRKDLARERERLDRDRAAAQIAAHDSARFDAVRTVNRGGALVDLLFSLFG